VLRIFIDSREINSGEVFISDKKKLHYLKDVLRLKKGDGLTAVDEHKTVYAAVVEKVVREGIILRIKDYGRRKNSGVRLTIACAIPKNARMDDIIDKLTQLGVDRIIPMLTRRVIIKWDKERAGLRLARWQKLALAAAGQSQRDSLPEICEFRKFLEIVAGSGEYDLKLIPVLIGERRHLKEILGQGIYKNILVLIGPEGDFTPQELQAALEKGFIPVTLGERVLRVDTAAVAVAALIQGTLP
jgi:16S rRNA (uracil1498-N3)-methyltransferase